MSAPYGLALVYRLRVQNLRWVLEERGRGMVQMDPTAPDGTASTRALRSPETRAKLRHRPIRDTVSCGSRFSPPERATRVHLC